MPNEYARGATRLRLHMPVGIGRLAFGQARAAGCAHAGRCTAAARSALGVRAAAPPAVRGGGRRLGLWNNPHSGAAGGVRIYMWRGCAFGAPPNVTWGGARHYGSVECSNGGHARPRCLRAAIAATAGKFGCVTLASTRMVLRVPDTKVGEFNPAEQGLGVQTTVCSIGYYSG